MRCFVLGEGKFFFFFFLALRLLFLFLSWCSGIDPVEEAEVQMHVL